MFQSIKNGNMDLYLDITVLYTGEINVIDEDELECALKTKDITKEDYELVNNIKDMLLKELYSKTNKYYNLDINKYIDF